MSPACALSPTRFPGHDRLQSIDSALCHAGLTAIVSSWVISPLMALIVVFVIFGLIPTFVLRAENSFKRAFYVCVLWPMPGGLGSQLLLLNGACFALLSQHLQNAILFL